ncbi:host specificity factor TipJ family phage tail protein [Stenotrophomonas rhizophila]|nr:host specificity factor TipJ family phage tail protein [Stenotrophomonas rhizophila]
MSNPAAGRLIVTPHPVLVDGQRNVVADLRPGESLFRFLMRHVEDLDGQRWDVTIGGKAVPRHLWHQVFPKHGQLIELRGGVGKAAIAIVAMIALTYFTFGIGTAAAAGMWGAGAVASTYGALAATAVYMAGAVLINQVLAPKQPKASQAAPTSYSISAGRNRARAYEPYGLAFGSIRIAPDLISQPYTHYEGDDQYLSMVLTPGINVDSVEAIYNGEVLLSSYDGVQVWHNGFPGMPNQELPLYSNADVRDGGTLLDTSSDPKGRPGDWVQRSSSAGAVRLMVGIEFQLYDKTSKGKDKENREQIQIQYRPTGTTGWQNFGNYAVRGSTAKTQRASYAIDVAEGQYDVRVRVAGQNTDGSGAQASFTWTTLTSIQRDTATYSGIARIGVRMKATGQLNGAPDELRTVVHARPVPVWKGDQWVTERSSNPGAQILAYARGIYALDGTLLAGMALPDCQIDIEGLKAFMLHCEAEGFTYNHWVTDVRSHQQVLDVVALAGFGQVCWPRGRLSVAWAADEQPLSGVVNMATIKKGQFQVDYMLANTADGIEYSYLDGATWEAKTLRVPAPGVTTMLNPAQVTGEGVTTEAHAAMLARWHLAQTLYQYKSIGYSTDIEHLSYSRMSMLALQHDMTQWGFGGRIMGAVEVGGRMVLQLDEPVPAPPQGSAFVGLRIPGERVYRVMRVRPFTGTAKELTLVDPWPRDAAVPGDSEANPAWDTIWIYDFKQTPGLRVRVTGIRPESDLKGAAVEVVAESREFWHYVKTGEYIPSPNDSLLQTRPVASELMITERQVVQGDTEYTELQATFAVSGPVGDSRVLSDIDGNGELEEVARTVTRTAAWRIPGAGTYPIAVRPYSPDGAAGVAASLIYTTQGADAPPVLVDFFDVEQLSGGVRRYTWGFFSDTIQSANFAGVEIRYHAGTEPHAWEQMTPLGDDGYHAAAFEAVLPAAGLWTFACRSRNTASTLSSQARTVQVELKANLGEVIDGLDGRIDETYEQALAANNRITEEILKRIAEDLRVANEAVAAARAYTDAQVAALNGILEDIVGADEWAADAEYPVGDFVRRAGVLYRALVENNGVEPGSDPAVWQAIGEYTSVGEALAAAISMSTQNATDLQTEAARLDALLVRMPAGNGTLATAASVTEQINVVANRVEAIAQRTNVLEAALPGLATNAYVRQLDEAQTNVAMALGRRIDQTNAVLAGKAEAGTVQQIQSNVEQLGGTVSAQGTALTQVKAQLGGTPNMLKDSSFARGFTYWAQPGGLGIVNEPRYGNYMYAPPISGGTASPQTVQTGQGVYVFSGEVYRNSNAGTVRLEVAAYNANGYIGAVSALSDPSIVGQWQQVYIAIAAPPGTTYLVCRPIWENTNANNSIRRMKLELGLTPTLWTDDTAVQLEATATQILEARAVQLENGQTVLMGRAGVLVDVNNRVIGWAANNDGKRGIFDIVADALNVSDPNGTGSTTFEDGRWVTRWANSGYILVQGKPFGNLGDLVMYYGQGSDPATVVKANAKFALDTAGNVFIAGALYTGGISRGFKSSTTVAQGVAVETGYLGRLGREVQVGGRFQYQYQQQYNGASSVITLGPGSTSAVVVLERNFAGDPTWTELSRLTLGGSDDVFNEQGAASFITQTISGQIFATDVASARQTSFRTRVLSYDRREHSVSNPGPTPLALQSQYQSIESME